MLVGFPGTGIGFSKSAIIKIGLCSPAANKKKPLSFLPSKLSLPCGKYYRLLLQNTHGSIVDSLAAVLPHW
jgi:hypothetical protein